MAGQRGPRRGRSPTTARLANLLILELGDAILGRYGEIAAAAGAIYRRVQLRDPEFVDQMTGSGEKPTHFTSLLPC